MCDFCRKRTNIIAEKSKHKHDGDFIINDICQKVSLNTNSKKLIVSCTSINMDKDIVEFGNRGYDIDDYPYKDVDELTRLSIRTSVDIRYCPFCGRKL